MKEEIISKKLLLGLIIVILIGAGVIFLLIKNNSISQENNSIEKSSGEKNVEPDFKNVIDENPKTPAEVITAYYKALQEKNYSKAASYLAAETKREFELDEGIESAIALEAEEYEKAGYTRLEIIEEEPIMVYCKVLVKCPDCSWMCGTEKPPFYPLIAIKEGNEWRIHGETSLQCLGAGPLPGKVEIAPSSNTPHWVALQYFKALFQEDYLQAESYLVGNGKDLIEATRNLTIDEDGAIVKIHKIPEEAMRFYSEEIREKDIEGIKGVIAGNAYARGKLRFCAGDAYCDDHGFELQEENGYWKIVKIDLK